MVERSLRRGRAAGAGRPAEPRHQTEPCLCAGADPRKATEVRRSRHAGAAWSRKSSDWCRCSSGSMKAPCTSRPLPAPASPPSAAGRFCRASPAPRPTIRSRRRKITRSGRRNRCGVRLPLLVPLRDFWQGHGLRPRAAPLAPERSGAGARRLGGTVGPTGLDGAHAQGPPGGRQRLPVAGRPGRGARLRSRNGAIVYPRQMLLSGLADALPVWEKAGNRTLLTSRPYGLDEAGLAPPRSAACPARATAGAAPGAVRQTLVPHPEETGAWRRTAARRCAVVTTSRRWPKTRCC